MATNDNDIKLSFPSLPAKHSDFLQYVNNDKNSGKSLLDLLEPYRQYDTELRKAFAQQPDHPAVSIPNILSVFENHNVTIHARDVSNESEKTMASYIMPLQPQERKAHGSPAIVDSLARFKEQFSLFSESALSDMDWSNVVAAGSSVVTSLLPVPEKYKGSKRSMRQFYHEVFAPASDIDLFIYGLSEEQAINKIRQIEQKVKDALLVETTTVRTKNAITIASQYPTRHIQIVLRVYKSISEILTGFDVDCSCAAFDGTQVWANPRAMVAYMTQVNVVDLTRRSPSYENRLSKYRHRGFEVFWPDLDRSRIDPTIYERSFLRTEGLARLLVLEKLPSSDARDAYLDQRRLERGRPAANRQRRRAYKLVGDIKADHEDELAEWVDEEDVSSYHTFTIPYGPKFHAAKIEKLLYTKDLLLNAEWNKPKDREVHLHRHPAFFGSVDDVIRDCCGYCPKPTNMEEEEVHETESKIYVSGDISFLKDDPGRQSIGSFNPLSAEDYTEMAYVGNTEMLCRAIVDGDIEYIESWLDQEGNDPDTRDYTGRTPLHLAVMQSTSEVVQLLINKGARLIARLVDGRTALHLACMRGDLAMVKALLTKSAANEEEENEKIDARREAHRAAKASLSTPEDDMSEGDSDLDMMEEDETELDATTENSIVNIKSLEIDSTSAALNDDDKKDPDVYDVNIVAWDTAVSPLHLAIVEGHIDIVKCLVQEFGADVLLPAKIFHQHAPGTPKAALLTLVLALQLPQEKAEEMTQTLFELGATCSQADMHNKTAFHVCAAGAPELLRVYEHSDEVGVKRAINHCMSRGSIWYPDVKSALMSAIEARDSLTALKLMTLGAKSTISLSAYMKAAQPKADESRYMNSTQLKQNYGTNFEQPVILAVQCELPEVALTMVREHDVDVNTLSKDGGQVLQNEWRRNYTKGTTVLDLVVSKLVELKSWSAKGNDKAPEPLQPDSHYLDSFEPNTYQRWAAEQQLSKAKQNYRNNWRDYVAKQKKIQQQKGVEEKQAAVFDAMDKYRELEAVLKKRGAKGFYELHPEIKAPEERNNYYQSSHVYPDFKGIKLEFRKVHSVDSTQRHAELFDAAWRGDVEAVKAYALMPWTDSEGTQQSPLRVSIQDDMGFTPFAIAVLRGHYDLADTILQLAQAQYSPSAEGEDSTIRRVRLRGQGDDDESDYSEDEDGDKGSDISLETEIMGDKFTIDNVGEVAVSALSIHQPSTMLKWGWGVNDCTFFNPNNVECLTAQEDEDERGKSTGSMLQRPQNLIQWAVWQGDGKTLSFLLDAGSKYRSTLAKQETEDPAPFSVAHEDFLYAISANNTQCIGILIRSTCAGVPLQHFIKKSGTESNEKPKYYQGLSVRGAKKKEWAMRGRQQRGSETYENMRPPMLEAAHRGSLETVEWFQSDAPLRCYKHYATTHPEDKRVQQLEGNKGGFEKLVKHFLGLRTEFALHCAVMSGHGKPFENKSAESTELVEHLIETMPESINVKTEQGLTPLHIAFALGHEQDARSLIKAGADQLARDITGRNIIHMLLSRAPGCNTAKSHRVALERMLNLIDKRLLKSLFEERSAAVDHTRTPFALWLSDIGSSDHEGLTGQLLLDASKGVELDFINGQGQTPLHTAVDRSSLSVCKLIIKHNPQLIHRENATGRTPYEQVKDQVLAGYFSESSTYRGYGPSNCTDDLTIRSPEKFIKEDVPHLSTLETIWLLMQDTKAHLEASGQMKRILVTLNEANEVARRLAATHAQRQQVPSESADGKITYHTGDEVTAWFPNATPSFQKAPEDDGAACR